jgi:LPXTG-motif cell wall-anchored protein
VTGNASIAQYGPVPTVPPIGTPTPGPHGLPHTGYAVAWPLAIGVVLIAFGMWVRSLIGAR